MSKKLFQTLRGYNGVQNLPTVLSTGGVTSEALGTWRGGDGVPPELGPQLLQDGDMEAVDFSAWTVPGNVTATKELTFPAKGLQWAKVSSATTMYPSITQDILTVGVFYVMSGYARGDAVAGKPTIVNNGVVLWQGSVSSDWQYYSFVFAATSADIKLYGNYGAVPGSWSGFDRVSVEEVLSGGQLPGVLGDTLYSTDGGAAIRWGRPAYGNGVKDTALDFSRGQYLSAVDLDFANLGNDDFLFVMVWVQDYVSGNERVLGKADSAGWYVNIDGPNQIKFAISDGVTSKNNFISGVDSDAVHVLVVAGVGGGSMYAYLDGVLRDTDDISAVGSISTFSTRFQVGNAASTIATSSNIVLAQVWGQGIRVDPTELDDLATQMFQAYLGILADRSENGIYVPDSTQFDTTFIEQYDDATGVTHAHKTSSNYATIGKWLDNNGLVFYGIRLAPEAENLFTYSNDLATGWALVNASMYTSDLVETPTPNIFAQGIIPSAALVAHYASYIKNIADTGDYCFSGYIREGNAGYAYLTSGPNSAYFCFDLGGFTNVVGFSRVDAVDMGGGWWLFFAVLNVAATGNVEFRIYPSDNFMSPVYLGDGVTPAIWVSFLQLEAGIVPTPRILTDGSTESRAADLISYTVDVPDRFWMTFEMVSPYGPNANAEQWVLDMATVRVYLTPSGQLSVGGEVTTTTDVCDGAQHLISIEVNQTNVTAVSISLYVDDVLEDTTAVATSLFGSYVTLSAQEPRGDAGSTVWVRDLQIFDSPPQAKVFGPGGRQEGDVLLYQTTDEGEINVADGITELTPDFRTMIYLSLFGGNEDDAGGDDMANTWWGNFGESDAAYQYRSETQHLLRALPATSSNLKRIADAVKRDLNRDFIATGIADGTDVEVSIPTLNKVSITGNISISGNPVYFEYTENWNASQ